MHKQSCFDPKSFGVVCPALETAVHTCSSANLTCKTHLYRRLFLIMLQTQRVQLHQKQDPSTGYLL